MLTKEMCRKSINILKVVVAFTIALFFYGSSKEALAIDRNKADLSINDEKAKSAKEIKCGECCFKYYGNDSDDKDIAWYKFVAPENGRYVMNLISKDAVIYGGFKVYKKDNNKYSEFILTKWNNKNSLTLYTTFFAEKGKEYYIEVFGMYDVTGDLGIEINKSLYVTSMDNIKCQKFYSKSGTISAEVKYNDGSKGKLYCDIVGGQLEKTYDKYHNTLTIDSNDEIQKALSDGELGTFVTNVRTVTYDENHYSENIDISTKMEFASLANLHLSGKKLNKGDTIEVTPQGCTYEIEKNDLGLVLVSENGKKLDDNFRVQVMIYGDTYPNNADVNIFKGNEPIVIPRDKSLKVFIRSFEGNAKFKVGTYGYDYSVSSLGLPSQITTKIDSIYDLGNDLIVKPANMGLNRIVWTSSNPAVATVSKSGKLTAISAGTTDITATVDGKIAICKVTVNRLPQQITDVRVKIDSNSKKYKKNLRITVKKSKLVKNSKKKNNNRKTKICKISAKSKTTVDFKYTSKNNKFSIDRNGNVYVKNKIRKGKYTLKFKLKASKSNRYKVRNKTLQIKVTIK